MASTSNGITEDEAALYDRQIRLWGVEAQNRMRSASVLVVNLRGIATEVCKNVVLAGIGKLALLDDKAISEEDLGTGFFFREEDVGRKRVESAIPRINALNPRVEVVAFTDPEDLTRESFLQDYDLIVLTDSDKDTILRTNATCRKLGKKFYATGSFGLNGYIFADLLEHEWLIEKSEKPAPSKSSDTANSAAVEAIKVSLKKSQTFVPFSEALAHTWKGTTVKRQKKMNPVLFATLVLWEYQHKTGDVLPLEDQASADSLKSIAQEVLSQHGASQDLLSDEYLSSLARTISAEFMPVCAIVGGVMGQDVLNTLGGREPPVINLFTYDGSSGAGDFYQLGIKLQS